MNIQTFDCTKYLCLDVETSGTLPEYGLQSWRAPTDAWITSIAYQHDDKKRVILSPSKDDLTKIIYYALNNNLTILCWNSAFDIAWLIAYGFDAPMHKLKHIDGMLLHKHLTNTPGHTISHGLKSVVAEYFPDEAGYEKGVEFFSTDDEKLKQLAEYNLKDVELTLRITEIIYNKLTPQQRNAALIEAECIPLIAYANYAGLHVDVSAAIELKTKLEQKALELLTELEPHGVTEKIIRSPAQLNILLFEKWNLPKQKGNSTDKEVLHELRHIDPRALKLRELRETLNLKTKFVEALIQSANYNQDNTTHPQAIIFGTYSGRLTYSSTQGTGKARRQTGFAIHQMKRDKEYRNLIKAPDGFTIVEFDAASQEYRLQALLSGDKNMLALCKGKDPHQYMADQIGPGTARQLGKVANLSMAYETSANTLKKVARVQYGLPMELPEATRIHAAYQKAYPGMVNYWAKQKRIGRTKKEVSTLAGRRLHLDGDWSADAWSLGASAVNYPIQGSAAEQKYLALSIVKPYLLSIGARFAFDLHDALYLHIPTHKVDEAIIQIKLLLDTLPYESAWRFTPSIPLPFDCKSGSSWGSMAEYKFKFNEADTPDQEGASLSIAPALQPDGDQGRERLGDLSNSNKASTNLVQVDFRPPNEHALEVALQFAQVGIKTFPCQADKSPAHGFMDWEHTASSDPDTLRSWFLDQYKATARMVGMPCGSNNLVAIDPDVPKPEKGKTANGVELFEALVDDLQLDITAAPVIISPSGGRHYIFAQPYDHKQPRFGGSSGALPESVDVKGDGGYVIASGSIRYDGLAYAPMPGTPELLEAFCNAEIPELPHPIVSIIGGIKQKQEGPIAAERMPMHLLREALLEHNIPNDKLFDGRDAWVDMAHAIYGASAGQDWGKREWLHWCSQRPQNPTEPERVWDTINPRNVRSGAGFIRQQLEDRGRNELYLRCKAAQAEGIFSPIEGQSDSPKPKAFSFSQFEVIDPASIPRRQFLYGKHYIRQFASASVAPGGVGKSSVAMVEAISMCIGRGLMDREVRAPLKVYYWNGEDPIDELQRRFAAIILHYELSDVDKQLLAQNLFVDSARDEAKQIKIAVQDKSGPKIVKPLVDAIISEVQSLEIDVVIIDPFVSCHAVTENDNPAIDAVAKTWGSIAGYCNASVELIHHVRKTNGAEITVYDSRGGGALMDAVRSGRTFNRMSPEEGIKAGVTKPWLYFREDDGKANMAEPEHALWRKMVGVDLPNSAFGEPGDSVGVATVWEYKVTADHISDDAMSDILHELGKNDHGAHHNSDDWAGHVVGQALGFNTDEDDRIGRAQARAILDALIKNKKLKIIEVKKPRKSENRKIVKPFEWVHQ
jgi:DNA polymerase I-like protein with 3'-5' exonuclease and polymerase domains